MNCPCFTCQNTGMSSLKILTKLKTWALQGTVGTWILMLLKHCFLVFEEGKNFLSLYFLNHCICEIHR